MFFELRRILEMRRSPYFDSFRIYFVVWNDVTERIIGCDCRTTIDFKMYECWMSIYVVLTNVSNFTHIIIIHLEYWSEHTWKKKREENWISSYGLIFTEVRTELLMGGKKTKKMEWRIANREGKTERCGCCECLVTVSTTFIEHDVNEHAAPSMCWFTCF